MGYLVISALRTSNPHCARNRTLAIGLGFSATAVFTGLSFHKAGYLSLANRNIFLMSGTSSAVISTITAFSLPERRGVSQIGAARTQLAETLRTTAASIEEIAPTLQEILSRDMRALSSGTANFSDEAKAVLGSIPRGYFQMADMMASCGDSQAAVSLFHMGMSFLNVKPNEASIKQLIAELAQSSVPNRLRQFADRLDGTTPS